MTIPTEASLPTVASLQQARLDLKAIERPPAARVNERKSLIAEYEYQGVCGGFKSIKSKPENAIRMVSFNVHSWNDFRQGPYRQSEKELDDIVGLIKAVNPDVIGLQEMVYSDEHTLNKFCEALNIPREYVVFEKGCIGVHGCENPDNAIPPGIETGNAIASKYPIREWDSLKLTDGEGKTEKRSVVSAIVQSPMGDIEVASAHLRLDDPTGMIRRNQVAQVCQKMEASGLPRVLMADTNGDYGNGLSDDQRAALIYADRARGASTDYGTLDGFFSTMSDSFTAAGKPLPKSTVWSGRAPDFILVSKDANDDSRSLEAQVTQSFEVPSTVSDHFMIVADIDAGDPPQFTAPLAREGNANPDVTIQP